MGRGKIGIFGIVVNMLPSEVVKAIFKLRDRGKTIVEIAKELDISKNTVLKYLKRYNSYENYLKEFKEKEYKKQAYIPTPNQNIAINRIITKQAIDYSTEQLAKQYTIFKIVNEELEDLAKKLDISIEELLKIMIHYFKRLPRYLELEEENKKLKEKIEMYEEVFKLIRPEVQSFVKDLILLNHAIENKNREFLIKLLVGGENNA